MEKLGLSDVSPARVFGRPALDAVWLGPAQYAVRAFALQASRRPGLAMILGPRACGKTVMLDQILLAMSPAGFFRISEGWESGHALLAALLESAGLSAAGASEVEQRNLLQSHLERRAAEGNRALFVVDDADRLSEGVWAELLRIASMRAGGQRPFMLLVGRAEAAAALQGVDRSASAAIRDRLHEMVPPSPSDCAAYIVHRLRVAGLDTAVFPPRVRMVVGKLANGSFVRANLLAQGAMLLARRRGAGQLSEEIVFDATRTMAAAAAERGLVAPLAQPNQGARDPLHGPGDGAAPLRIV